MINMAYKFFKRNGKPTCMVDKKRIAFIKYMKRRGHRYVGVAHKMGMTKSIINNI